MLVNISVNLEIGGRGPGTDGQGDLVVEEVDDQVEVDRLLPVHVRVADRQFPAVPPGQEIRNHVLLHDLALNLRLVHSVWPYMHMEQRKNDRQMSLPYFG